MRYDPDREVYRDCRWCNGKGCLYCKAEADKAYRADHPAPLTPIASFDITNPEGVAAARAFISKLVGKPENGGAA